MMKFVFKLFSVSLILLLANCQVKDEANNIPIERQQLDSLIKYYQSGDIIKCIKSGKLFIIEYPTNDVGWQILGGAYLFRQEDSLAGFYTEKAILLNPNNTAALTNFGVLLDKQNNYDSAEIYYKKAIVINPNFAQAYSNYVGNRLIVGDYKAAVLNGEKAVALADNIKDKAMLCFAYHKSGMNDKRDTLYKKLENLKYANLQDLNELFSN